MPNPMSTANAVVVTRVINAEGVFGYTISAQAGNNLVTNPDPGTETEVSIAGIGLGTEPTSFTITRFAKPVAGEPARTEPVLPKEQMLALVDIAVAVETVLLRGETGLLRRQLPVRRGGQREADIAGHGAEDPSERPVRLQAGPRVRREIAGERRCAGGQPVAGVGAGGRGHARPHPADRVNLLLVDDCGTIGAPTAPQQLRNPGRAARA